MRRTAPVHRPVVLTIAGSDSGGGAGIQADIKTIEARGCFATSAITAVTAQHTRGVERVDVLEPATVEAQITAVTDDIAVDAIKTGMLATEPIIDVTRRAIESNDVSAVIDPVMIAASGDRLLDPEAEAAYDDLIALATVVTPNADEATALSGVEINGVDSAIAAGEVLLDRGAEAALIKGGHIESDPVEDVLVTDTGIETFTHPRIDTDATHGSGCTLASAIAAELAKGVELNAAVADAIALLSRAIRYHHDIGGGPGAVNHLVERDTDTSLRPTIDAVETILEAVTHADGARSLIPEVGMNVVGALAHAETQTDTVAVDGRIVRTRDGLRAGPVRIGASGHVARLLFAAREHDPRLQFAVNCRLETAILDSIDRLGWSIVEVDRREEPETLAAREGQTMSWVIDQAFAESSTTPSVVFDRGDVGKEPMTRILAEDADTLADRLAALAGAVNE